MVNSHERFADLASRIGFSDESIAIEALANRGWQTQSGLAYLVFKQDQVDDQIIAPILGDPESADPGLIAGTSHRLQASCLRRLFERYTATMSHFKRKAEATDHTEPRKLSRAEKAHFCARFDAHGMTGFKSRGKLDPSDHYLERLAHLMETDDFDFKVMEWEKVTIQPAPLVKVSDTAKSASGFWREASCLEPEAPVTNSLMQAYQLLHRRGIAWDMISPCPFSDHEKIVEF